MQIFEVFMFIVSVILLGVIISNKPLKKQYVIALISITILVLVLHIAFGNTRWQLYSLYTVLFVSGIVVYFKLIMHFVMKNIIRISVFLFLFLVNSDISFSQNPTLCLKS